MVAALQRPPNRKEVPLRRRLGPSPWLLQALACALGLRLLSGWVATGSSPSAFAAQGGPAAPQRRQSLALLGSAVVAGGALLEANPAAAAVQGTDIKNSEIIRVPAIGKAGTRSYIFEKPKGFRRLASVVDPSGFTFRNVNDTYFTFITRAEKRENATEFTPGLFIEDYRQKFVNATGSSFSLIKGGPSPDRIDEALGVKYYDVEYVVRTQLGFSFDTLKSLHFLTTFAATPDSLYIMNCQAADETWERDGPILQKVSQSFSVTS